MHELRIAIGLLACTAAWLAIAPASPTLIALSETPAASFEPDPVTSAPAQPAEEGSVADGTRFPDISPEVSQSVRTVAPSPGSSSSDDPPVRVSALPTVAQPDAPPQFQIFNRPVAVDAGTMKAGRTTIRVAEVEPISPDAQCSDGSRSWPCGIRARTAFRSWLRGRSVLCAVPPAEQDAADLTVSCLAGEADVGEWLVANGWAAPTSEGRYSALGDAAKAERRGIWAFDVAP